MTTRSLSLRTFLARRLAKKSLLVAEEGDEDAVARLRAALADLGAVTVREEWGVVGSLEMTWTTLEIGGGRLIVDQETGAGITLRGDTALVARVEAAMGRQRAT
jgi:hypothetical protein